MCQSTFFRITNTPGTFGADIVVGDTQPFGIPTIWGSIVDTLLQQRN